MPSPQPVQVSTLLHQPDLVHGFSTRAGGTTTCYGRQDDLNLGFTNHDDPANVRANRTLFLQAIGGQNLRHFGLLRQVHSADTLHIRTLDEAATDFLQPAARQADGLMTNVPGVLLTIQVADCIPVLLFDPRNRAIAAFHAGWRGTAAAIVQQGITGMHQAFGTQPQDLIAAIGPGIGPHSYTVGNEVHQTFADNFPYAETLFRKDDSNLYLDLWEANRQQLLATGVPASSITVTGNDTAANTGNFFSHRAEKGHAGRMMAAIGLAR